MKERIARFAVRASDEVGGEDDEGHLILGLTHHEIFKPGHLYEMCEILGEYIIRDLGLSAATVNIPRYGPSWSNEVTTIVTNGGHLFTVNEFAMRRVLDMPCSNCGHPGREHRLDFKCLFNTTYFAQATGESRE
jgi:hypothetical protein